MKKLYFLLSLLFFTGYAYNQIEIHKIGGGVDYSGSSITLSGTTSTIDIGSTFYVINNATKPVTYNFGILPIAKSNNNFKFQFCNDGGSCYTYSDGNGPFWKAPNSEITVAPGDSTKIEIKLQTLAQQGNASAYYYVLGKIGQKLDSVKVNFESTLGINKEQKISFSIFPNPAQNSIHIQASTFENGGTAIIRDAVGKIVRSVYLSGKTTSVDIRSLKKGIYFINISSKNGQKSIIRRLIKQ